MILTDAGPLVALLNARIFTLDHRDFRIYRPAGIDSFELIPRER